MTSHYTKDELFTAARLAPAPHLPNRRDRTFDLHPALFALTIGGYFAFLGFMAVAFMNRGLAIPFVIFATFIAMAFAVPGMWARIQPERTGRTQTWAEFRREGMDCGTGHLDAKAAIAQVLILPGLLVVWGAAILIIRLSI